VLRRGVVNNSLEFIDVSLSDSIGTITFNRPEKLNALNPAMMSEIKAALMDFAQDDNARVIRLRGAGRAFTSGGDLTEGADSSRYFGNDAMSMTKLVDDTYGSMWDAIWNNPKPVVAQVHGYCVAFGLEIANACDFVVAARGTQFGTLVARFGEVLVAMLPWTIGIRKARELILTPRMIDAEEALTLGLVNSVVDEDDLEKEALDLCRELASIPPEVLYFGKRLINKSLEMTGVGGIVHRDTWQGLVLTSQTRGRMHEWNETRQKEGLQAALKWINSTADGGTE
jgi:enoyl-CoA hydratase/carnithine racemase